jgi:hypothetical protein
MESTGDYLKKRAQELNLDRGLVLKDIQKLLDRLYAGQTRVLSLNDGVLKVATPNASVASELRWGQSQLLLKLQPLSPYPLKRLAIIIRALS